MKNIENTRDGYYWAGVNGEWEVIKIVGKAVFRIGYAECGGLRRLLHQGLRFGPRISSPEDEKKKWGCFAGRMGLGSPVKVDPTMPPDTFELRDPKTG